jgi:hypothetical protein
MAEAVPTKESTDPGTSQTGDDVYLKQMEGSPFGGSAGDAMNAFLEGLSAFGAEFSRVSDTLIQFFQATKLFLQAFKNPLVAALIETIDALIEALEEMDALGFGSVSVWPWKDGTYPQPLNTDKLDEAVLGLVAAMSGLDATAVGYSERGTFVKTKNGESLLTPGQELLTIEGGRPVLTKAAVYDTLMGIRNFFHPELWKGSSVFYTDTAAATAERQKQAFLTGFTDPGSITQSVTGQIVEGTKDALFNSIDYTQKNLLVKELTPEDCVDKIISSLSGSSPDSNKPTGSGPYKAFMIMFTLPTINDVIQIVQSFVDYFGSVIGDEMFKPSIKLDDAKMTISLGESLHNSTLKDTRTWSVINGWEESGEAEYQQSQALATSEWFYELGDFKPRTGLKDGTYKNGVHESDKKFKIPMFKPGEKIVQEGGILGVSSFSAEVIEHLPIVILNGMVMQNSVKVKSVRGELQRTNHKPLNSATSPIVRAISKKYVPKEEYAIFRTDTLEKPIPKSTGTFFGTIREGSTTISEIIPTGVWGDEIRTECESAGSFKKGLNILLGGGNSQLVIDSYMGFIRELKKGAIIDHQYLQPFDLSDRNLKGYDASLGKDKKFSFNYGKLLDVFPSIGVQWHVANIKVGGTTIESMDDLTKEKLFKYPNPNVHPQASPKPTGMNSLEIELGFLNFDGTYTTDLGNFIDVKKAISPPDGVVYSWKTKIPSGKAGVDGPPNQPFQLLASSKNLSPNWKYIRVSDLFPAYGATIDQAIGMVRGFKKQVESIAKSIDAYIAFLERQIVAIQRLNDQIQQLIAFFSKGLNAAGLYSAQFSGDGIGDFKKKLSNIKAIQTAKNKVHEISLETVESETVIQDPFTGLDKTVKRQVLRPSIQEQEIEPDGIPKALSELDNLKYSGAIVFFAQGPDISKFDKFMDSFGALETLGKGFLANLFNKDDSIAQKIVPYVYEIQGQDKDGNWIEIERLAKLDDDGTIRIKFTNDANELNKADRNAINKQMERTVEFSPKIQMGNLLFSGTPTKNDAIALYRGTFGANEGIIRSSFSADTTFYQFSQQPKTSFEASLPADENGIFEKEFFNIDLKTKDPMPRTSTTDLYKVVVQTSIISLEGQSIKERKNLNIGFDINPVTVEFGELI